MRQDKPDSSNGIDRVVATAGSELRLSLLVPAFNSLEGFRRIVNSLKGHEDEQKLEILVSDDSTDDTVAAGICALCSVLPRASYRRNVPPLGAVHNWNSLLDEARGDYALLLHHDEAFCDAAVLRKLLDELAGQRADVWILRCQVAEGHCGDNGMLHFPAGLSASIVSRWPQYLLRRNLIGSPSALLVRRNLYARYDARFVWRVDVECYFRILIRGPRVRASGSCGIVSYGDTTNSITAKLRPQLHAIEDKERLLLRERYGNQPGVVWIFSGSPMGILARAVESGMWFLLRGTYRLGQKLALAFKMPRGSIGIPK